MVLRLILVGLVGGLGLSAPTQRELDAMSRSAQEWVVARLAEWETETTSEHGTSAFLVVPADSSQPLAVLAPAPTPATTPTLVSDNDFGLVLDDTVAMFAQDELASATREMDELVKSDDQLPMVDPSQALAIDLPAAPVAIASEDMASPDLALEGPAQEEVTEIAPAEVAAAEAPNDPDQIFEGVIEEVVLSFDLDTSTLASTEANSSDQPLEISEDLYEGEAYALNQISDGIEDSIPSADKANPTEDQLTQAVRLTRQAVFAWASLLHGPAVVSTAP